MDHGQFAPELVGGAFGRQGQLGFSTLQPPLPRGKLGLPVERDLHFEADKTISAYAEETRTRWRIAA